MKLALTAIACLFTGYVVGVLHMGISDNIILRAHGLVTGSHALCAVCNPHKDSGDA